MMKLAQGKIFLLPVMAAVLVACGGGSDADVSLPPETITLEGTVAKGLASGAKIRVLSASATPVVLASGVTSGTNGRFTVKINKQSGPVVIEADLEGADIADELNPGKTYKGLKGEKMRAIISSAATPSTANVTPFSEMAVDLVDESGWKAEAVTDANNIVRQLLNNTDHLIADPTKGDMLAKLTAVQQMVQNKKDAGGLGAVLKELRDAADGSSTTVSIKPVLTDTLKEACGESTACAAAFATPPVPVPIGTGNGIDAVRGLFQDIRDTLLAYSNDTQTGELDKAGDRLNGAVQAAVQPIDDEMLGVLGMFTKGDQLYRDFKAGNTTQQFINSGYSYGQTTTFRPDGTPVFAGYLPRYGCELARATIETKTDGSQDVKSDYTVSGVTKDNANVFACYGVGTAGRLYPARDGVNAYYQVVTFIPQANGSLKYVHQLRTRPFDQRLGVASRVKVVYGNLNVNRDTSSDLTGFTLNGQLVPGLKGHAAGEYALLDRVDASLSFLTSKPTTSSVKLDLSGSMTLYKKDNVFASSLAIASGSMLALKTDIPSDRCFGGGGSSAPTAPVAAPVLVSAPTAFEVPTASVSCPDEEVFSALSLDVTVTAPGVKFQGIVKADTPSFDSTKTVYYPTKTSFQGKIFEADGTGYRLLLDGKGSVELLNYANFNAASGADAPMSMAFDGKVLIKNRPEMGLTLAGSQTAAGAQSLSGTFFWNSKALKFEGAADGAVTVSSDSGVRFTIPKNGNNVAQDVFQGNVKVGTVNIGQSRIDYADGRFQQY